RSDSATMQFDEPAADEQADAEPALRPVEGSVSLREQVEHAWQQLGSDSDPVVHYGNDHFLADAIHGNPDLPALKRVLDRIQEQVTHGLLKSRWVRIDVQGVRDNLLDIDLIADIQQRAHDVHR